MSFRKTIRALLDCGFPLDPDDWQRRAARIAWVRKTTEAWLAAQLEMDERCTQAVDRLSEEAFERLCEAEQAKVDAIRALLDAVDKRDLWPRELYFSGV